MKKKGLFLVVALSVMMMTGCGEKNTGEGLMLQEVTQEEDEEDVTTEHETAEPTTRIVDSPLN